MNANPDRCPTCGHAPIAYCPWCHQPFDPTVSHDGAPIGPRRRYCSHQCRTKAQTRRRILAGLTETRSHRWDG